MAKSYYLKRTGKKFNTQKEFSEFLSDMLNRYIKSGLTVEGEDRLCLIDYLEDIHSGRDWFLDNFNLEMAEIFVKFPNGYNKKQCFHIKSQQEGGKDTDFSISKFSSPTAKQNLSSCFRYLIKDIKIDIRKQLNPTEWEDYDLVHVFPKFKDTVDKFIQQENLSDKLELVISGNYGDNNVPFLKDGYEYLAERFIDFYKNEYQDYQTQYSMKKMK